MKTRNLYILVTGALLLVFLIWAIPKLSPFDLQGRWIKYESYIPTTSYSLNSDSPSGYRSVEPFDTVFIFDAEGDTIPEGTVFNFKFYSGTYDISAAFHEPVILYLGEDIVGYGAIVQTYCTYYPTYWGSRSTEMSCEEVEVDIPLNQSIFAKDNVRTFNLKMDTLTFMDEGASSYYATLTVSMTVDGQTVEGKRILY